MTAQSQHRPIGRLLFEQSVQHRGLVARAMHFDRFHLAVANYHNPARGLQVELRIVPAKTVADGIAAPFTRPVNARIRGFQLDVQERQPSEPCEHLQQHFEEAQHQKQ